MRRYTFYLSVALLAFGIGSFVVFNFYWITNEKMNLAETKETIAVTQTENNVGRGFASSNSYFSNQTNEINEKPKITCGDKSFLPLWKELKKDKSFREYEKDFHLTDDCAEMLVMRKEDLNKDGRNELILQGNDGNLCSPTGACGVWIYQQKDNKFKLILSSSAFRDGEESWIDLEKKKTNDYQDVLLKSHASGYETIAIYYRFNGIEYKEKKCLFINYYPDEKHPSIMTCKEAWKR
jgi:hypothetical protein